MPLVNHSIMSKKVNIVVKTSVTSKYMKILDFIVIERMVLKKFEVVALVLVEATIVEGVNSIFYIPLGKINYS